jgi:hypothetical protein
MSVKPLAEEGPLNPHTPKENDRNNRGKKEGGGGANKKKVNRRTMYISACGSTYFFKSSPGDGAFKKDVFGVIEPNSTEETGFWARDYFRFFESLVGRKSPRDKPKAKIPHTRANLGGYAFHASIDLNMGIFTNRSMRGIGGDVFNFVDSGGPMGGSGPGLPVAF